MLRVCYTICLVLTLVFGAFCASTSAQAHDGDLIVSLTFPWVGGMGGFVIAVNPASGTYTTIEDATTALVFERVRMAANNTDLIVAASDSRGVNGGYVIRMDTNGVMHFLVGDGVSHVQGIDLDHDGRWVMTGVIDHNAGVHRSAVWTLDGATQTLTTLFRYVGSGELIDVAIDHEVSGRPLILMLDEIGFTTLSAPRLLAADRGGVVATIFQGTQGSSSPLTLGRGVEVDPGSGDYLTTGFSTPYVARVTKNGAITSFRDVGGPAIDARFGADGTAWIAGSPSATSKVPTVIRLDMQGTVIQQVPLTGLPFSQVATTSVEIYGSRRLVCNGSGMPGTRMQIQLQSRRAEDANTPYAVALSFGQRPGITFKNVGRLNLAVDPLFLITASDAAPALFADFHGATDQLGNATATVKIPANLPAGLKVTVFAAAVLYDATGIRSVTNTHAFVLN